MQVKTLCPRCQKGVKVDPSHIGKRARCPHCLETIVLTAPQDSPQAQSPSPIHDLTPVTPLPSESQDLVVAMREHTAALREWSAQAGQLGATLADQVAWGWERTQQRIDEAHAKHLELMQSLLSEMQTRKPTSPEEERASSAREWVDLLKETQTQLLAQGQQRIEAEAMTMRASLAEAAGQLQQHLAVAQENQANENRQLVASLVTELRTLHTQQLAQGQQRVDSEMAALRAVTGDTSAAFGQIALAAESLPASMGSAMDACGVQIRAQLESAAQQTGRVLAQHSDGIVAWQQSLRDSAQAFADQLKQLQAAHGSAMAESMAAARTTAAGIVEELSVSHQLSTDRLEQIAVSLAQQAQGASNQMHQQAQATSAQLAKHAESTSKQLAELLQTFQAAATNASQQVDRARAGADEIADHRVKRLSADAEALLTETYRRSEEVMRQTWELSVRAAAQQQANLAAMAAKFGESLEKWQQSLMVPLSGLQEMFKRLDRLAPIEQSLARSLQVLETSAEFKRTLASLDQTLTRLNRSMHGHTPVEATPSTARG